MWKTSFIKDGIVLVDTPGIGGSGEFNEKVIEYIPNAVVFIFVINVYNAGGMQEDRVRINNKKNPSLSHTTPILYELIWIFYTILF